MKKKAIVLLITLFFVASMSALILKNLKDTDIYIKQYNQKISKVQILSLLVNVREELKRLVLAASTVGFELGNFSQVLPIYDANIVFDIKDYEKYDINILGKNEQSNEEKIEKFRDLFYENQVSDFDRFRELYVKQKRKNPSFKIKNKRQLDRFLEEFAQEVYNRNIYKISKQIGFLNLEKNSILKEKESSDKNYEFFINISYLDTFTRVYMVLSSKNSKVKEEYFELSFK